VEIILGLAGLLLVLAGMASYAGWGPGPTNPVSGSPQPNATTVVAASGNAAAATCTATLAAVSGRTLFLEGFDLTASGPTTASAITFTVTGLLGGTLSYTITPIAGVLLNAFPNGGLFFRFPTPLIASAANTAIAVVVPTLGAGSTNCTVVAYGLLV
jgi:hypothetical protein